MVLICMRAALKSVFLCWQKSPQQNETGVWKAGCKAMARRVAPAESAQLALCKVMDGFITLWLSTYPCVNELTVRGWLGEGGEGVRGRKETGATW